MKKSPALLLNQVSFAYGNTQILSNVNLVIEEGEFVGIFGPNGGGKTTLLRLLTGFLKQESGEILLFGESVKRSRSLIGYVPQIAKTDRQFPITAEEVVQMGRLSKITRFGFLPKQDKEKALQALERVGMLGKKDRPFGKLSGGEAQRVLIARALAGDPKLLLLDEPTASVDPAAEQEILALLTELKGSMTILMVTHDLQTILHQVQKLFCVHGEVHSLSPSEVCEHFGLGLYHTPLIQIPH